MLNIFPIQFLAPIAYLVLRICLGAVFIRFGFQHFHNRDTLKDVFQIKILPFGRFFTWWVILWDFCIGTLLILGFLTQIAALLAMLYSAKILILYKYFRHPVIPARLVFVLILTISLSLFITGAGAFALDLPI